ncbi:hypothetical protein [Modestobacter sp. Leaf380]|uniref:hypothetical protein n=1 Tax=Modestobacter sp. Leaf380 TaxID=1736356 RepID=UPI0006F1F2D5|nr:hypothetical protein [Modestobacter sp. Leaf380]KQS68229.1 hypothetical protein ASG41_04230 [Modestobacter sp. Leaf380]
MVEVALWGTWALGVLLVVAAHTADVARPSAWQGSRLFLGVLLLAGAPGQLDLTDDAQLTVMTGGIALAAVAITAVRQPPHRPSMSSFEGARR